MAEQEDHHVEYVAFTADSGSISKMAMVRRPLARVVGRYLLGEPIAAGGMATVHLGRLIGPAGFSRTVAVKRLHSHLATNPEFVQRFVDEARIASRVRHSNVVQTLDVVRIDEELLLVLDYVHGESFARLRRLATAAGTPIPPNVAAGIVIGVLRGLHAAHEAKSVKGTPLGLVHRDVSPQNIMVGADGIARVLDFGIAKAAGRVHETLTKSIKGKLAYMSPEQLGGDDLDRRADLFAVGVVLWEALAGERLFRGEDAMTTMEAIYHREPPRLSERDLGLSPKLDDVLARALAKNRESRFETAASMARALESALVPASDREVAEWVEHVASELLEQRLERVAAFEGDDTGGSRARLYAADAAADTSEDPTSARRDALMPPPMDSVTNEHETLRGQAKSFPTLPVDTTAPMLGQGVSANGNGNANDPPGSMAFDGAGELRPLPTPMVMITPAEPESGARLRESGPTRIGPVEQRMRALQPNRTPIPMPMLAAARAKRRMSMLQLALLVMLPPFFAAAALSQVRPSHATGAGAAGAAAEVQANPTATSTMMAVSGVVTAPMAATVTAPAVVTAPPAAPLGVPTTTTVANAGDKPTTESAQAKNDRSEKKARPVHRSLARPARPVPIAITRLP